MQDHCCDAEVLRQHRQRCVATFVCLSVIAFSATPCGVIAWSIYGAVVLGARRRCQGESSTRPSTPNKMPASREEFLRLLLPILNDHPGPPECPMLWGSEEEGGRRGMF